MFQFPITPFNGIFIRPMSLGAAVQVMRLQSDGNDLAGAMSTAIAASACDAKGDPLFANADDALVGVPFAEAGELFAAILAASGLGGAEAEKNPDTAAG